MTCCGSFKRIASLSSIACVWTLLAVFLVNVLVFLFRQEAGLLINQFSMGMVQPSSSGPTLNGASIWVHPGLTVLAMICHCRPTLYSSIGWPLRLWRVLSSQLRPNLPRMPSLDLTTTLEQFSCQSSPTRKVSFGCWRQQPCEPWRWLVWMWTLPGTCVSRRRCDVAGSKKIYLRRWVMINLILVFPHVCVPARRMLEMVGPALSLADSCSRMWPQRTGFGPIVLWWRLVAPQKLRCSMPATWFRSRMSVMVPSPRPLMTTMRQCKGHRSTNRRIVWQTLFGKHSP